MAKNWAQIKAERWGLEPPPNVKHGPNTWAAKAYGCPCSTCLPSGQRNWRNDEARTAPMTRAERTRRLREAKKGQPVPPGVKHGGPYAFRTYGCTCPECLAWKAGRDHRRSNPWMYRRTRGHWSSDGRVDRIWWPADPDAGEDCPFEQCFHIDHKETRS